ncbi:hypothetical protein AVEN_11723-1 [Araneus ventricosus]|uniref:Uncharacterized protein n=1 Tax=Araneus ventricosus TaxID=182803 RepID=A0A4Y2IFV5_ARAVE|nr:hypothetical protein AVEN_11723-1 [Araneus ventricosus]
MKLASRSFKPSASASPAKVAGIPPTKDLRIYDLPLAAVTNPFTQSPIMVMSTTINNLIDMDALIPARRKGKDGFSVETAGSGKHPILAVF